MVYNALAINIGIEQLLFCFCFRAVLAEIIVYILFEKKKIFKPIRWKAHKCISTTLVCLLCGGNSVNKYTCSVQQGNKESIYDMEIQTYWLRVYYKRTPLAAVDSTRKIIAQTRDDNVTDDLILVFWWAHLSWPPFFRYIQMTPSISHTVRFKNGHTWLIIIQACVNLCDRICAACMKAWLSLLCRYFQLFRTTPVFIQRIDLSGQNWLRLGLSNKLHVSRRFAAIDVSCGRFLLSN